MGIRCCLMNLLFKVEWTTFGKFLPIGSIFKIIRTPVLMMASSNLHCQRFQQIFFYQTNALSSEIGLSKSLSQTIGIGNSSLIMPKAFILMILMKLVLRLGTYASQSGVRTMVI